MKHKRCRGIAMVEWVISMPLFLLLGLGCVQWALIWEARSALNYATLLAARAGAVSSLDMSKMEAAFDKGLFVIDRSAPVRGVTGLRNYRIRIMSPSKEAFKDFGEPSSGNAPCAVGDVRENQCEIPNDRLARRTTAVGQSSGVNIQDANLLKIEVVYRYELKVPFVGPMLSKLVHSRLSLSSKRYLLPVSQGAEWLTGRSAIPITATATVRMQSPARYHSQVLTRAETDTRAARS